jgi:O-acetylhomoserine/O-acetylserine sulfhydrylase-like pyridoxal-dependent enzyme
MKFVMFQFEAVTCTNKDDAQMTQANIGWSKGLIVHPAACYHSEYHP